MNGLIVTNLDSSRIRERVKREKMNHNVVSKEVNKLMHELKDARIVEPSLVPPDVVTMNSVIKLSYEDGSKSMIVQLVYPEEANIKEYKISIFAPLSIALLGCKKGSTINWSTPKGIMKLHIDEIIYQPEASGDYHL